MHNNNILFNFDYKGFKLYCLKFLIRAGELVNLK